MSAQREWKPGDVAWARYTDSSGGEIALRTQTGWMGTRGGMPEGTMEAYDLRPLVVIDPDDREQMEHLLEAHNKAEQDAACKGGECGSGSCWIDIMQAALREFANPTPPKPDEPQGLGAVVKDARGVRWVRTESAKGLRNPWQATLHPAEGDRVRSLPYADISAVRVLSEGVTDAD